MAIQREIVDKDGNRLTVVQGGAGKAAVYGKTAAGEWVPLQVDDDGRAVLNVGEVSATIGVVQQGAAGQDPWLVQLSGNKVSHVPVHSAGNNGIDVSKHNGGLITVNLGWSTVHFEASYDGNNWLPIKVYRKDSGSGYYRLDVGGTYLIDLTGVQKLRFVADYVGTNPVEAFIGLTPETPAIPKTYLNKKKLFRPKTPKLKIIDRVDLGRREGLGSDRRLYDIDLQTGTIYAGVSRWLEKSTDLGQTWSDVAIKSNPNHIFHRVFSLSNGSILAFVEDWDTDEYCVEISKDDGQTWEEKHRIPRYGFIGFANGGVSIYENVIIYSQYANRPVTAPTALYLSRDFGETWTKIHESPAPLNPDWHYHDVAFDPYRNLIWYVNGDHPANAMVAFTDDWGVTWNNIWTPGQAITQFTTINPMPDMVLFGSDQPMYSGSYRLLDFPGISLNQNGATPYVLEPAYCFDPPGKWRTATHRGKQYYDCDNTVYLATQTPNTIFATRDGITHYQLFESSFPDGADFPRIFGVFENKLLIGISENDNGNKNRLYIFEKPEWEEI